MRSSTVQYGAFRLRLFPLRKHRSHAVRHYYTLSDQSFQTCLLEGNDYVHRSQPALTANFPT